MILYKMRTVENFTSHYIGALGCYRFFYILSWVYKYLMGHHIFWTSVITGIVQTLVFAELVYEYFRSVKEGKQRMEIPLRAVAKEDP
mmetsp:Transcript_40040/g.39643  ORF Transcript_40040/g.39643 Transcript_40040/m.39643 type:complete len:87 (-) Transcript_40040:17-277(-)